MVNIVSLQKRIEKLEKESGEKSSALLTVCYKDKDESIKSVYAMNAVALSLNEGKLIDHFEEAENSANGGVVEGLANILLRGNNDEI